MPTIKLYEVHQWQQRKDDVEEDEAGSIRLQ